jgi:hypothetical protein
MYKILFISLFFVSFTSSSLDYKVHFGSDYEHATAFFKENHALIKQIPGHSIREKNVMNAIVFPELIRYSMFRDFLETKALQLVYVQYGKEQCDFSIGRFQMKPSFAEELEDKVASLPVLSGKYSRVIAYSDTNKFAVRKERVRRLQDIKWQYTYLQCFYDFCQIRLNKWKDKHLRDQIRFMATLYNHKINASNKEIEKWMHKKCFPYGTGVSYNYCAYSDLSVHFYQHEAKEIINK